MDGENGAEDLLGNDLEAHLFGCFDRQHGGRDARSLSRAARELFCALFARLGDPALDTRGVRLVDEAGDERARVERVFDFERRDASRELADERVVNRLVDEEALRLDAHLTGVRERRRDRPAERPGDVGVFVHEDRGVAAELEKGALFTGD